MSRPLLGVDEGDFERERGIVEAERSNRLDDAPGQIDHWLASSILGAGPTGARPVAGTPASLQALAFGDASAFTKKYYRPERMTLLLVVPEPRYSKPELLEKLRQGPEVDVQSSRESQRSIPVRPYPLAAAGKLQQRSAAIAFPILWLA